MPTPATSPAPPPEVDRLIEVDRADVVRRVLSWYDIHKRDLPWRAPTASAWSVLVSEFMLQQTPVERVRGPWQAWMDRWPTPGALADAPSGEAVRAWGRLGYPRRALRLHQTAVAIVRDFDGEVPADRAALLSLPGVGSYTAAAVASFAYGRRETVLDTNVRRVLARIDQGQAFPAAALTRAETALADAFVPVDARRAATWAVAAMELGALVCTARSPRCPDCPVQDTCRWRSLGHPAWDGPPRRGQTYAGTDRQCRGALLAVVRSDDGPVDPAEIEAAWADPVQRDRALDSLLRDGLIVTEQGRWSLPG